MVATVTLLQLLGVEEEGTGKEEAETLVLGWKKLAPLLLPLLLAVIV